MAHPSEILSWLAVAGSRRAVINTTSNLATNFALFYFLYRTDLGERLFSRKRLHQHAHTARELKSELRHALLPEIFLSLVTLFTLASNQDGPLRSWFRISWELSWSVAPRIAVETVLVLAAYEIYFYFLHLILHRRRLFKAVHVVHHQSLYPTPLAGTSMDLREAAGLFAFYFAMVFCPLHIVSITLVSLVIKLVSLIQHCGHEIFPDWWRRSPVLKYYNSTMFHQLHHSGNFNRNFGFQTSVLDRVFGTVDPVYLRYEAEKNH